MSLAFASFPNSVTISQYQTKFCPSPFRSRRSRWQSSMVAVAGATGGVGRLVVNRLLASIVADTNAAVNDKSPLQAIKVTNVRALVRDEVRAREVLPQHNKALSFYRVTTTTDSDFENLQAALTGVEVLIICTGTTAFPTTAWRDGNTPTAVDDLGVKKLVTAVDHNAIKRVVLLSSIGTHRTSQLPFVVLNAFGVMDAKRRGEMHVQHAARRIGFSYAVLRPGRLIGSPHTNVGMLRKEPHPRILDIEVAKGDALAGDLSRSAAADAVFIAAKWDTAADLNISVVHREGPSPVTEKWELLLKKMQINR